MSSKNIVIKILVVFLLSDFVSDAFANQNLEVSSNKSLITINENPEAKKNEASGAPQDNHEDEEVLKEIDSINTIDTTSGNWLLKRAWWEKTEEMYEQLKELVSHITAMRAHFVSQRNESDRALDILFSEVGLEQGVLLDIVSYAKDLIDKEKTQGSLNAKEKAFAEKVAGKERELEQLKIDIKGIDEIDNKIDEALDIFFTQIDLCNKYEHKAWENFKDVARELDDKEARKLYYNTQAIFKDVQNIKQYLEGDFKQYFDSLLQKGREHSQKISAQINALKSSGVDIKKESKLLEKESLDEEVAIKDKAAEKKKLQEAEKKRKEELLKSDYLYSVKSFMNLMVSKIKNVFGLIPQYLGNIHMPFLKIWEHLANLYKDVRDSFLKKFISKNSVNSSEDPAKSLKDKKDLKENKKDLERDKKELVENKNDVLKDLDKEHNSKEKVQIKENHISEFKNAEKEEEKKLIKMPIHHSDIKNSVNQTIKSKENQKINNETFKNEKLIEKNNEISSSEKTSEKTIDYYTKPEFSTEKTDLSYYGM